RVWNALREGHERLSAEAAADDDLPAWYLGVGRRHDLEDPAGQRRTPWDRCRLRDHEGGLVEHNPSRRRHPGRSAVPDRAGRTALASNAAGAIPPWMMQPHRPSFLRSTSFSLAQPSTMSPCRRRTGWRRWVTRHASPWEQPGLAALSV